MTTPQAQRALEALKLFGRLTKEEARELLATYARRDELTEQDTDEIVATFRSAR